MLKSYKDLKVWQKAYSFCLKVYKATVNFPDEEKFGITSQIRRAVVSIPSNIAEGYGRKTKADYVRFLYIAYGSVCEVETQIMLSGDLGYIKPDTEKEIVDDNEDYQIEGYQKGPVCTSQRIIHYQYLISPIINRKGNGNPSGG